MNAEILKRKTMLGFFLIFILTLAVSLISPLKANAVVPKVPVATVSTTTVRNVNNDNINVTVTSNRPAAQISYVLTTARIYEDVRMVKLTGSSYHGVTVLRPEAKNVLVRMYSLPNLPGTPWVTVNIAPSLKPPAPTGVQVLPNWKDDTVKFVWRQPAVGLIYQVRYYRIDSDPLLDYPIAISPFVSTDNYTFKNVIFGSYKANVIAYRPPVKPQTVPVFATGTNFINFTIMPPTAPTVVKNTIKVTQDTKTSAVISWQTPAGATSDLKYKVYVDGDDAANTCAVFCSTDVKTPSVRVSGLVQGSSYEITIEAYYDEEYGKLSEPLIYNVPPPPVAPAVNKNDIKIVTNYNTKSVTVTWKAPAGALTGLKYKMYVLGKGVTPTCSTSIYCSVETQLPSSTVNKLFSGETYYITIDTYYEKGYETHSPYVSFTLGVVL